MSSTPTPSGKTSHYGRCGHGLPTDGGGILEVIYDFSFALLFRHSRACG